MAALVLQQVTVPLSQLQQVAALLLQVEVQQVAALLLQVEVQLLHQQLLQEQLAELLSKIQQVAALTHMLTTGQRQLMLQRLHKKKST